MSVLDLINKLGEVEDKLPTTEIVSPVYGNRKIATRLSGMVYQLNIPRLHPGWYKFRPLDHTRARKIGEADQMEIDQYLRKLPRVRMILIQREGPDYVALPCRQDKVGEDLYPLLLVDNAPMDFDTVIARYDGIRLWYHDLDSRNDPQKGEYLRGALNDFSHPDKVKFPGLTLEERCAYSLRFEIENRAKKKTAEEKLREAVEHGGGNMLRYVERADHYSITYTVDERQYTSRVRKDDGMQVVCAGFCLSGEDEKFDLKSLIPVLKQGHRDNEAFAVWDADDPHFRDPHRRDYHPDD